MSDLVSSAAEDNDGCKKSDEEEEVDTRFEESHDPVLSAGLAGVGIDESKDAVGESDGKKRESLAVAAAIPHFPPTSPPAAVSWVEDAASGSDGSSVFHLDQSVVNGPGHALFATVHLTAGSSLTWSIHATALDVDAAASWKPDASSAGQAERVGKHETESTTSQIYDMWGPVRCAALEPPGRGSFTASCSGSVIIRLDNRLAFFTPRRVRLELTRCVPIHPHTAIPRTREKSCALRISSIFRGAVPASVTATDFLAGAGVPRNLAGHPLSCVVTSACSLKRISFFDYFRVPLDAVSERGILVQSFVHATLGVWCRVTCRS
jgi:hypothetical protein